MPALTPEQHSPVLHHRARLNALRRYRDPDDPAILDARRELASAGLEDHIRRVIESAPPLTAEQVDRIRGLLPAPSGGDTDVT